MAEPIVDTDTSTEIAVVRGFLRALERFDMDGAEALLHPDVTYQNVPGPPAKGRAATMKLLRAMAKYGTGFEARIHNIAGDGTVVLTERTDALERGRFRAEFWVCGTFEVQDGLIILWRDYFDYADVTIAILKGAVRALLGRARR